MVGTRICTTCKIFWDYHFNDVAGQGCPSCGCDALTTMNAGDVGTAIYFRQSGDKQSDYVRHGKPLEHHYTADTFKGLIEVADKL